MKIKDLEKLVETGFDGKAAYAICCIGDCHYKVEAFPHYGDIQEAKSGAFLKLISHIKMKHKIEIEYDEPDDGDNPDNAQVLS